MLCSLNLCVDRPWTWWGRGIQTLEHDTTASPCGIQSISWSWRWVFDRAVSGLVETSMLKQKRSQTQVILKRFCMCISGGCLLLRGAWLLPSRLLRSRYVLYFTVASALLLGRLQDFFRSRASQSLKSNEFVHTWPLLVACTGLCDQTLHSLQSPQWQLLCALTQHNTLEYQAHQPFANKISFQPPKRAVLSVNAFCTGLICAIGTAFWDTARSR